MKTFLAILIAAARTSKGPWQPAAYAAYAFIGLIALYASGVFFLFFSTSEPRPKLQCRGAGIFSRCPLLSYRRHGFGHCRMRDVGTMARATTVGDAGNDFCVRVVPPWSVELRVVALAGIWLPHVCVRDQFTVAYALRRDVILRITDLAQHMMPANIAMEPSAPKRS